MEMIVDKFLRELNEQLVDKKVAVTITDKARRWMAEHGHDPQYGARPLSRLLQTEVKDRLSDEILFGILEKGGKVLVDVKEGKIAFSYA